MPITHPRSHASLAKDFLAEFVNDDDLLAMAQLHDEPYALWRAQIGGKRTDQRLESLMAAITDWNTFLLFQIIDNCTAGKDRSPLRWFFGQVTGRVASRIDLESVLTALEAS